MPKMVIQKLFLITCIAGLTAAAASIGHAEKLGTLENAAKTGTHQTTPRICPTAHRPTDRLPVYKRYLKRTRAVRSTPRRG